AFATYKTEFKAKGLKGEEKIGAKVYAIKTLAYTQHKKVVDQLAKLTKNRDQDIRTAAVQYLGMQRALPGYAGTKVMAAMTKHKNDSIVLISGLQAIQDLEYRACEDALRELMRHDDYAVQKSAMFAIGEMKDMRLLPDVFQLLKKIKLAKGDKWDGVSVTYDTGTAGDHDQKMAEKIGKEQMKKNERKGRGGGGRSQRDLGPVVEEVMKKLTGEEFSKEKEARDWLKANDENIKAEQAKLNDKAKAQLDAAKKTR
nr:HEAT repeat domain-containing protein [Planctomycetota bacterium]